MITMPTLVQAAVGQLTWSNTAVALKSGAVEPTKGAAGIDHHTPPAQNHEAVTVTCITTDESLHGLKD